MRTAYNRAASNTFPTALLYHQRNSLPKAAVVALASLVASHFVRTISTTTLSSTMPPVAAEAYSSSSIASARSQRLVYGSDDALFGHIEAKQGTKPFGSFLDAGTGVHSLRWIATLASDDTNTPKSSSATTTMKDFTAVTADENMRKDCQKEVDELGMSHLGKVVIGNWFPPNGDDTQSLSMIDTDEEGNLKQYDTILADYLIGAMDGFSPYTQDQMIDKLAKRLRPGGRLYIVGLQPIPDSFGNDRNSPQNIICEVRKVRDACILLAGDRCYREYPLDWIERQITKTTTTKPPKPANERNNNVCDGEATACYGDDVTLELLDSMKFPIMYRHSTIVKQINVGRNKLSRFPSKAMANEMKKVLDDLEKRSKEATEKIPGKRSLLGFDYVCVLVSLKQSFFLGVLL